MNLFEISPTIHWATQTDARACAVLKTSNNAYELVVVCNKHSPNHVQGWLDKVISDDSDIDKGRFVTLTHKDHRESTDGLDDAIVAAKTALVAHIKKRDLKYVCIFSTTPKRKVEFAKLMKSVASKMNWKLYQDRNYILIHKPSLDIVQPD